MKLIRPSAELRRTLVVGLGLGILCSWPAVPDGAPAEPAPPTPTRMESPGSFDPIPGIPAEFDSWTAMSSVGAPLPRRDHAMVWTGHELLIWGGYDDYGPPYVLNDGGRYDPATDSWRPISRVNAPREMILEKAVWTGSVMVVWGATSPSQITGGRYDPVTDRWTSVNRIGAPRGRYGHSTIWTGTEMIIWGGDGWNSPDMLNDGAAYDPILDRWRPLSRVGAPTGRSLHATVWTGSEMIVWGGSSNGIRFDSGGRYDPASDVWRAISTSGAPSPRTSVRGVWTGHRMVVWGGDVPGGSNNSGARYDPETDRWFSMAPAPTSRLAGFTQVWTGREMLIWGGRGFSGALRSGSRYDPTRDTWTAMSVANAPTEPNYGEGLWTGEEMIVWGGDPGSSAPGGRYRALPPNRPPVAVAGVDQSVECGSPAGTEITLDGSLSSDPDSTPGTRDDIVLFEWIVDHGQAGQRLLGVGETISTSLPLGQNRVTLRVTDMAGEQALDDVDVEVIDSTAPWLTVQLTPAILWPPNHRMEPIEATVVAGDLCGTVEIRLESVVGNEPDDDAHGGGDGHTSGDVADVDAGSADFDFRLRAERSGSSTGRIYTATYVAIDESGNSVRMTGEVHVPHGNGGS